MGKTSTGGTVVSFQVRRSPGQWGVPEGTTHHLMGAEAVWPRADSSGSGSLECPRGAAPASRESCSGAVGQQW